MEARVRTLGQTVDRLARKVVQFDGMESECPSCGGHAPFLARVCPDCGGQIKLRLAGLAVVAAVAALLAAILVAAVVMLRWQQLSVVTATGAPADELIAASSSADFSWLATAMSDCDAGAKADPAPLHLLVVPLASADRDLASWRAKSINSKGDGVLLHADDALDALKQASLRIYPADYVFSIADQATGMVYRWRTAIGVARFATAAAGSLSTFKVQFRTSHAGDAADWGTQFNRQDGSCYWVNAIIAK